MASSENVIRCNWLIMPDQQPRQDIRITVEDGVVTDICDLPAGERSQVEPIAVVPQFVNAHTHLEFSDLREPLQPPSPFTDWVGSVVRHRNAKIADECHVEAVVASGLAESHAAGTGVVGEISTSDAGVRGLIGANQTIVSFRELLGFSVDRAAPQLEVADSHLSTLPSDRIINGISPHAPYSVHPDLFSGAVEVAEVHHCPIAMHLAETRDELELLDRQTGIFRDLLESLNLWSDDILKPETTILSYLRELARLPRALAVHCNYVSDEEIQFLGEHPNVAVVYCPRTHAWFGHSEHPWKKLISAGVRVILGTDSRASNPDLSIWKELQHVARKPGSPPLWELLPMITSSAAAALGIKFETGITVGEQFEAVLLPCECSSSADLNTALLSTGCQPTRIS